MSKFRQYERPFWRIASTATLLTLIATKAVAQTGTVAGTVNDRATGMPVPAARIQVVGLQSLGIVSDDRGRYVLRSVPPGQHTVRVTRIGFRPETQAVAVQANDTARVNVQMSQSAIELTSVVVTGTGGAVEKTKIGSSLGQVDLESMQTTIPTTNFSNVLSSKVAGVRSVGVGGGVGSGQDLRIRGIASFNLSQRPVIYIDGVRVDTRGTDWTFGTIACCSFTGGNSTDRLSDLNPNDIERVEILKGAAAATLYGSEATNGVIQIFTKRGKGEARTTWNLGLQTGYNRLRGNLPTKLFPNFTGPDGTRALDANGLIENGPYYGVDLSATGGTQRSTYFASVGTSQETGSIQPNDQTKANLRLNMTILPTDKTTIEARSSYTRNKVNELQAGNNWTALLGNAMNGDPRKASAQRPYGEAWVSVTDIKNMQTVSDADRWTGGVTLSHQLSSNLTNRLTTGVDVVGDQKERFFPYAGEAGTAAYGPAGVTRGQRNVGQRNFKSYTVDYLGQLNLKVLSDLTADFSWGAQGFWETDRRYLSIGNDFAGPGVSTVSSAAQRLGEEQFEERINIGGLVQSRFSYKDRLFSTVGLRVDGASAFGNNYDFQKYPKADVAYLISSHGFLPSWVNTAKVRAAIGRAGKMPGAFDSFTSFEATPVFEATAGIIPSNPGNKDLRPEVTTEMEAGFEAGFLKDRLGLEVSYYKSETKDAIFSLSNPPSAGFVRSRSVNLGAIQNKGWEASLNILAIATRKFEWSTNIRADGNKNKITDLGGINTGQFNIRLGYPVGGIWALTPVEFKIDPNGKPNTVRSADRTFYGPPLPTFNGSWGNTLRYGPMQFYALVTTEQGAWFSNGDRPYRIRQGGADEYLALLDASGKPTFAADSLFDYYSKLDATDSRDNIRLREVSLTYNVPENWSSRLRVGYTTVTVSGQNIMWWDDCHCVDPNMNWAGASSFGIGSGFLAQPSPRVFRFLVRTRF